MPPSSVPPVKIQPLEYSRAPADAVPEACCRAVSPPPDSRRLVGACGTWETESHPAGRPGGAS